MQGGYLERVVVTRLKSDRLAFFHGGSYIHLRKGTILYDCTGPIRQKFKLVTEINRRGAVLIRLDAGLGTNPRFHYAAEFDSFRVNLATGR